MTVKDWNDLKLPVAWCIYKESEPGAFAIVQPKLETGKSYKLSDLICEFCGTKGLDCDCYDKQVLNLDAPVPDGVYRVKEAHRVTGWETGITVKDRRFEPKPTAECLYRLAVKNRLGVVDLTQAVEYDADAGIDHIFVEEIRWNDEGFEVFMAS